jgi:NitT/TauT family transport system ATP-binding protein
MSGRLDVRAVSYSYSLDGNGAGTVPALAGIGFAVPPAHFLSIIGPSGCGKSTLLALIAGFLPAVEGEIAVDGRPVSGPAASRVLLTQEDSLFPWKTARDNVAFGLKARGLARREQVERAERFLELVGLGDFADRYPFQLSGGMKQRLALARALVVEPRLMLLDEPFGALDSQSRQELQDQLLAVWEDRRPTVLLVTHDLDEAIYLADSAIVLTPRPGSIAERVAIDLPRPRHPELRFEPAFEDLRQRLWRRLRDGAPTAAASIRCEEERP